MATLEETIAKLREVQKFTTPGREFTEQELQINPADSPLIKELKKGKKGRPIMVDAGTQNELATEIIKQKDQEITNLNTQIKQKDNFIQSLQLKNEKLRDNQKKLYGYLADA